VNRIATVVITLALAGGASAGDKGAARLAEAPSRFAKSGEVKVHYKSLGTGKKALVLVHGWSCDLTFWSEQVPALAGKVRLVLIDLPGHGKSDRPEVKYSMDFFAKAVDAVLTEAGVEEAVLAGHSMGTPVARQYYRLYPKKTRGLIAVDGSLRRFSVDPKQIEEFLAKFKGPEFKKVVGKFVDGMFTADTPPAVRERVKKVMESASPHVALSAMEGMFDPAVWKDDKIEVPVLALMAPAKFWDAEYEKYVRQLVKDLDYRVIQNVSHFLQMERPQAVNEAIVAFLKKQGFWVEK
jgi:pimeloyl-ACP methyl ester carboxylesterase